MHELNPPAPFSCKQKKGEEDFLTPLCEAERGWGEFMKIKHVIY
jgi:hypothetical protein